MRLKKISFMAILALPLVSITAIARAENCRFVDEIRVVGTEGEEIILMHTGNDCEVWPGITVKKGASVQWWSTGERLSAYPLADDTMIGELPLGEGAFIAWHRNGQISHANHFTQDFALTSKIWTHHSIEHASATVNWDENGNVRWVQLLGKDIFDEHGNVVAAKCSSTWFTSEGDVDRVGDQYICE